MGRRSSRGVFWGAPGLIAAAMLLAAHPAPADDGIAYITPSRDNTEIHVIAPDGSRDEKLWQTPGGTARENGIGALSWSPDGEMIAFDSGHDWRRSMALRDIYTLRLGDQRLTRPMNAPDTAAYAALPKGAVTVDIRNGAIGRKLEVYVAGAAEPKTVTMQSSSKLRLTFENVADFGPNIPQYVRVFDHRVGSPVGQPCWFDVGVAADVEPGKTVHAGETQDLYDANCPVMSSPVWRADGAGLFFLFREINHTNSRHTNNIWQVEADPHPGDAGQRLLQETAWATNAPRIAAITASPKPDSANDVLMLLANQADRVMIGDMRDPGAAKTLGLDLCFRCQILGAALLPDASGFLVSRFEEAQPVARRPTGGVIYAVDLASGKKTEILRLPGEVIGRLAISPDGTRIVFERASRIDETNMLGHAPLFGPRLLCPCALWIAGRDGSAPKLLARDGRAPAWRPSPR
jgi:hypothetical protein